MDKSTGGGDENVFSTSGEGERDETDAKASSESESAISMKDWVATFRRIGADARGCPSGEGARVEAKAREDAFALDVLGEVAVLEPFLGLPRGLFSCDFGVEVGAVETAVFGASFLGRPRGRVVGGAEFAGVGVEREVEDVDRCAARARDAGATLFLLAQH